MTAQEALAPLVALIDTKRLTYEVTHERTTGHNEIGITIYNPISKKRSGIVFTVGSELQVIDDSSAKAVFTDLLNNLLQ